MAKKVCTVDGCDRVAICRGWCSRHYQQWRTTGNPIAAMVYLDDEARFWTHVDKSRGECWLWTSTVSNGYGQFRVAGQMLYVHRWSYEHFVEPIPPGLQIDHLCHQKLCVRPAHLQPTTARENLMRAPTIQALRARQTHCIHGHRFDEANTYIDKNGWRECRQCGREKTRRRRAARRAQQ